MNNHQGEQQPDFYPSHHYHKKKTKSNKRDNNVGTAAAVNAAFLATATGASFPHNSYRKFSPPTYGQPTTSGNGASVPPKLLLEVPSQENNTSGSTSPMNSSPQTSISPISSISGQLKELRKRSLSEISLILDIIKGVTAGDSPRSSNRRFRTASPSIPRPSTSSVGSLGVNKVSLSTGDLKREGMEEENRKYLRVPTEDGKTSPALSRISSFGGQQKRNPVNRIRWNRLSPQHIQKTMDMVQEEKAMQMAPNAPVDANKFVAYVQERRKKRILFKGEYLMVLRSVDLQKCTTEVGIRMGDKNQYNDTLPYDYNRVILESRSGFEESHGISDYINASYVQSWMKEKAYVVTQAVKTKQASNDFWRCVWEMRSNAIVMLTKVFDFMRVMCLQYWPQAKFQFGEIDVETLETKTYAHFVIRTFRLKRLAGGSSNELEETRIVKHFHFTEWELNSFPYISAFIELRRRVRQWTDKTAHPDGLAGPVIVHCSNGGGRSGAFLALDANLELLEKTGQVDVYEYAKTLVNSRQHLIESVDQYTFIYDTLCEAIMCNIEPIEMHRLKERSTMYKSKKDRELMEMQITQENKLLLMLTSNLRIGDCAGGHRLENRGKNRDVMVVPPDHARPYLQTLHGESKDYTYINAVEVDGFTRKSEFIVTEWPKQQTLDSFWTLVFDHSVHTVINLTNPSNNKIYPPFIHSKGKKNYGPFTVEIVNCQQYPGLTSFMAKITKRTFMISEIMATGASQQQLEAEVRLCCIIQVKMWPIENKVPCSTSALIDLIKMTRSWRKRAPDRPETKPTIVMSHNGVSRCGIFIGANVCIDQMDMDHEVDVFHAVKMIRLNRPQQLQTKDEYKYLYDLCLHYYMTNPEYRIHEPPEPPVQPWEEDFDEEVEEVEGTGGIIGAITVGLSRSRSSSRRGRSIRQSVRSRRSPTAALTNNCAVKQPVANNTTTTSSRSPSKKKETVYLN